MIQKTLISVGASLSAVFVLLYFFRRKKVIDSSDSHSSKADILKIKEVNSPCSSNNNYRKINPATQQDNISNKEISCDSGSISEVANVSVSAEEYSTETVLPVQAATVSVSAEECSTETVLPVQAATVSVSTEECSTENVFPDQAATVSVSAEECSTETVLPVQAATVSVSTEECSTESELPVQAATMFESAGECSPASKLTFLSDSSVYKSDDTITTQFSGISEISITDSSTMELENEVSNFVDKQQQLSHCHNGLKPQTISAQQPETSYKEEPDSADGSGEPVKLNTKNLESFENETEKVNGNENCMSLVVKKSTVTSMENISKNVDELSEDVDNGNSPIAVSIELNVSEQANGIEQVIETNGNSLSIDNYQTQMNGVDAISNEVTGEVLTSADSRENMVQRYYDNHKLEYTNGIEVATEFDYFKIWPQPDDGKVFIEGSLGQPLVPEYLRDPEHLTNREIPMHNTRTTAYLFSNMNKLELPSSQWMRVISVSDTLELRMRHDQRDMLLEQMEKKGVCNPCDRAPQHHKMKVGSMVAAQINVPKRGLVWCRAHITSIVREHSSKTAAATDRQMKEGGNGGAVIPAPRFMVESIDYYPACSETPVSVSQLRPLSHHAMCAPFFDQLYYLLNVMPTDSSSYDTNARHFLLDLLRQGNNYFFVSYSTRATISGVDYWFACATSCAFNRSIDIGEELNMTSYAKSIFAGVITEDTMFNFCMFKDGEAYWAMDDRNPTVSKVSWGPDVAHQDFIFMVNIYPRGTMCYSGFRLPYKHSKDRFKAKGYNLTFSEFIKLYQRQRKNSLSLLHEINQLMTQKNLYLNIEFDYNTMMSFYQSDLELLNHPEAHLALQPHGQVHAAMAFPKDDNGFLIVDTYVGAFRRLDDLRRPINTKLNLQC